MDGAKPTGLILRRLHSSRLEGWPRARSRLGPSFETVATLPPQDKVNRYDSNHGNGRLGKVEQLPCHLGNVVIQRARLEAQSLAQDIDQDRKDGEPPVRLVVGRNEKPRRLLRRR